MSLFFSGLTELQPIRLDFYKGENFQSFLRFSFLHLYFWKYNSIYIVGVFILCFLGSFYHYAFQVQWFLNQSPQSCPEIHTHGHTHNLLIFSLSHTQTLNKTCQFHLFLGFYHLFITVHIFLHWINCFIRFQILWQCSSTWIFLSSFENYWALFWKSVTKSVDQLDPLKLVLILTLRKKIMRITLSL